MAKFKFTDPSDQAMFNVVNQRNKDKNFVKRGLNPMSYPNIKLDNGGIETHRMSYSTGGKNSEFIDVYPNITQNGNKLEYDKRPYWEREYIRLPGSNPGEIEFAKKYAENGLINHNSEDQDINRGNNEFMQYPSENSPIQKLKYGTKDMKMKKYNLGVQKVDVSPGAQGNEQAIMASMYGSKGATLGGQIGQFAGPLGQIIGSGIGMLGGAAIGNQRGKEQANEANLQRANELAVNQGIDYQNMNFGGADKFQQKSLYDNYGYINNMDIMAKKGLKYTPKEKIEVEKDELIFRENPYTGKEKLIADFKGGKTHEEGGEDFIAEEGDTIFPGKMRNKVVKLLDQNGNVKNEDSFEDHKEELPEDNGTQEFPDGVRFFSKNRQKKANPGIFTDYTVQPNDSYKNPNPNYQITPDYNVAMGLNPSTPGNRTYNNPVQGKEGYSLLHPEETIRLTNFENRNRNLGSLTDLNGNRRKYSGLPSSITDGVNNNEVANDQNPEIYQDWMNESDNLGVNNPIDPNNTAANSVEKLGMMPLRTGDVNSTLPPSNLLNNLNNNSKVAQTYKPKLDMVSMAAGIVPTATSMLVNDSFTKENPEVRPATNLKLKKLQYEDRSNPLRNANELALKRNNQTAVNYSGGSASGVLSNMYANNAAYMTQDNQIENTESQRADQVDNANVQIQNQENMTNASYFDQNVTANEGNRARTRDIQRKGQLGIANTLNDSYSNFQTLQKDNKLQIENDRQYGLKEKAYENQLKYQNEVNNNKTYGDYQWLLANKDKFVGNGAQGEEEYLQMLEMVKSKLLKSGTLKK